MAGPRSPTSSVLAKLILRRWRIISLWCCADFQQRSNERLVVLPQTRSRAFHGVEDFFYLDGRKLFNNIRIYGWAVLPQTRPSSLHGVEGLFRLMLCSQLNTFNLMAGPRSPSSPVTAQLILQRWRLFSFWCCADFQQRLNERMVVLPQTQPSCFHGVEIFFFWMVWSVSKTFERTAGPCSPKHSPVPFHGVKEPFRLHVLPPFKNIQIHGWAALPNIPCHGSAHFAALKNHFVLMLCRL